jgi:hypothetical protein
MTAAVRSIGTWALVGAVCVLGLAALVDSLLGGGHPASATGPPSTTGSATTGTGISQALLAMGVNGTLEYVDQDCSLHAVALPRLEQSPVPLVEACGFTTSPGGVTDLAPDVRSAVTPYVARCDGRTTAVTSPPDTTEVVLARGCDPAWTPDGRLTVVRDGELVVVRTRKPVREATLVSRAGLAAALADTEWGGHRPFVREAGWLTDHLVALLVGADRAGDALVLLRDGKLTGSPLGPYPRLSHVRPSPQGTYVAAMIGDGNGLVVADRRSDLVGIPGRAVRAIAWRWDEAFAALASEGGTILFEFGTAEVTVLPIIARDLVWN